VIAAIAAVALPAALLGGWHLRNAAARCDRIIDAALDRPPLAEPGSNVRRLGGAA
jgi:hypothetical protein